MLGGCSDKCSSQNIVDTAREAGEWSITTNKSVESLEYGELRAFATS